MRSGLLSCFALLTFLALDGWAGTGGSVSGTVKDVSSAVITNATVNATNVETGVQHQVTTNGQGFYSFPDLAIGRYNITIQKTGFNPYQRTGITVDANSALVVDAVLEVGVRAQAVTVNENAVRVETSDTQIGEIISGSKIAAVPLDGRSYTDLLALQPGVVPATSLTSNTQQDVGVSALSPSGGLNPGTISINGQREFSNAFIVNGSDAEEDVNSGAAIIPNLDSIAEFRILTSNFDAEYGGHSGGQINVVTKSGTNQFHGDAFEFLRNTNLDARNYFSPTRGTFDQNQFGGTFGGPIRKSNIFFFADYQGTRLTQGIDTGQIPVPSLSDRSGNLLDLSNSLTGTVTGPKLGKRSFPEIGLSRFPWRTLLHGRMRGLAVRSSQRRDSGLVVVHASEGPAAIHSAAKCWREPLRDLQLQRNFARRQRRLPPRLQQSLGLVIGLLFPRRLHSQQSISRGAERSQRARFQRALFRTRSTAQPGRH